ncbi:MAG: hypothetical protein ACPL6F_02775 [Anaerolineales bacterium]
MKKVCIGLINFLFIACLLAKQPITVDEGDFVFTLPPNWKTMRELWGSYTPNKDYYKLNIEEVESYTNVQKKGQVGLWFAIARKDFDQGDLYAEIDRIYRQTVPDIPEYQINQIEIRGVLVYQAHYRRPWGEPWWEFEDYWFVRGNRLYLLSFHALKLADYSEEITSIIDSIKWK